MQLAAHFVHSERLVYLGDASRGLSVRLMFSPFCWFSNAQVQHVQLLYHLQVERKYHDGLFPLPSRNAARCHHEVSTKVYACRSQDASRIPQRDGICNTHGWKVSHSSRFVDTIII